MSETIDPRGGWTSASNAEPDLLCPGRHFAQRGMERKEPGKWADFGSKIHACLGDPGDHTQLDSLTVAEREIYDACRKIEKGACLKFFGPDPIPSPRTDHFRVFREQRYWVKVPDGKGGFYEHSGQPDVVFRKQNTALIVEYKTLPGDVPDSPDNLQTRDQVALVRGNYVILEQIGAVVIQPLVTHDPVITRYTKDQAIQAERDMFDRVRASHNPNAVRHAGEVQCAFCLAKTRCVDYQKWAGQLVPVALMNVLEIPIEQWSPDQRSHAASQLAPAFEFLESIKQNLKSGLEKDPEFCPGWTLKAGAKIEKIVDAQKVFERFMALGGKLEQFMPCIAVGKGKLKEQLHAVTFTKGKELEEHVAKVTEGATVVTQNAPSLVRVRDSK